MKVLFLSAEVAPFAKTGGLADVAGALPIALAARGHDVRVVMPRYRVTKKHAAKKLPLSLAVPVHLQGPTHRSTRRTTLRAARRPRRLALRPLHSALAFCCLFFDRLRAPVLHVGYGARRAAGDTPPLVTFAAPICALRPPPRGLLRRAAAVHAATGQRRWRRSYHRPAAVELRAPSTDMPRHPDVPEVFHPALG